MPGMPPSAPGFSGWPTKHISYVWDCIRTWLARLRYPHAVYFGKNQDEWNEWYEPRYEWMMGNVRDPLRSVWLDMEVITWHDRYTMPSRWVRGSFRFKREEDAVLYRMVWS